MSSKLSVRRATVRKPAICTSGMSCDPPQPIDWPPKIFEIHFKFTYNWEEGPVTIEWSVDVENSEEIPWTWESTGPPFDYGAGWYVVPETETAELVCSGWDEMFDSYMAREIDIPVIMNSSNNYVITTWDEFTPGMFDIRAEFTF